MAVSSVGVVGKRRFIEKQKKCYFVFFLYFCNDIRVFISIIYYSSNSMSANALGVISAVILLASFVLRGEKKIRLVNLIGCVFLVLWAVRSNPTNFILVFMGVAIILVHLIQFWHMMKEAKANRQLAKAEAKAADAEAKAADAEAKAASAQARIAEIQSNNEIN